MTRPETRKMIKDLKEGAKLTGNGLQTEFEPDRIACCMILGDSYDINQVKKCVKSLKDAEVDKLFIAFNGKTRRALGWLWAYLSEIELPFLVQKFGWENDFSKARNQSFEMVPKDEFDWIMWIDSDDILVAEKPLREVLKSIDEYTQGVYLRYDYAVDPATNKTSIEQWRERIFTTKINWMWVYPVHEVVFSGAGTQFAKREGVYVRHQRNPGANDEVARKRNRQIISAWLAENPKHPRAQFYFANETMAEADTATDPVEKERWANAAILAFRRFLTNEEASNEDKYHAACRIGDLQLMIGEFQKAVDSYLTAVKVLPLWPEAFIGVAHAAMRLEDWERCRDFSNLALNLPAPITPAATTPLTYSYTPLYLRGVANENLLNFKESEADYKAAQAIWNPPNGMLDQAIERIERKVAVTSQDKDQRKSLRGKRPEKSIAFVTAPLVEPWHPLLEAESGAGGAETCIMRLAPRFAADGWRTVVFGTPGEHRGVDKNGVEWWESNEFLPNEEFKIVVASRVPEVFSSEVDAQQKYLWMHDVNLGPRPMPFLDRIDQIIGLTNWHVNHMSKLYGVKLDKFSVVPNGIELDLYKHLPPHESWRLKTKNTDGIRFIWSSSPDRGLVTMLALWPHIKDMWPDARLDIFYGWNIIDRIIAKTGNYGLALLKEKVLNGIWNLGGEQGGIYQHGRVPQKELADWQLASDIWAYPTDFMETFCITAIEMQAAGVIPVTSSLAALKETVACKNLLVEGWPLNVDYQRRYLTTLRNVVESPNHQELIEIGRAHAEQFTWDRSYQKWLELINGHGKQDDRTI